MEPSESNLRKVINFAQNYGEMSRLSEAFSSYPKKEPADTKKKALVHPTEAQRALYAEVGRRLLASPNHRLDIYIKWDDRTYLELHLWWVGGDARGVNIDVVSCLVQEGKTYLQSLYQPQETEWKDYRHLHTGVLKFAELDAWLELNYAVSLANDRWHFRGDV